MYSDEGVRELVRTMLDRDGDYGGDCRACGYPVARGRELCMVCDGIPPPTWLDASAQRGDARVPWTAALVTEGLCAIARWLDDTGQTEAIEALRGIEVSALHNADLVRIGEMIDAVGARGKASA